MALNPATFSTRTVSMLMLAAFAGIALWLFLPSFGGPGSGSGSGNDGGGSSIAALPPSLKVSGEVVVTVENGVVRELVVPLTVHGGESIALDGSAKLRAETLMAPGASAAVPATFTIEWLGGNGDSVLDPGETAVMTVLLPATTTVYPQNPLALVLTPAGGAPLRIEDVLK